MGGATIAVVDDDPAFLAMMQELLSYRGYQLIVASQRYAAFDLICRTQPDLIIVDMRMEHPRAGLVLLDLLQVNKLTASIPVIVCSADIPLLRAKKRRFHAKGWAVLEKPFGMDDLFQLIEQQRRRGPALLGDLQPDRLAEP